MYKVLLHCWLVGLLMGGCRAARTQGHWRPGNHPPGLNGPVTAVLVQANGDIVAGGTFTDAGGHPTADYVARWDGHHWQPLGEGPGPLIQLTALHSLPNGHLLVAGIRPDANQMRSVVTRWDGRRWQPLGTSLPATVRALAALPSGDIWAGGDFGLRRWDGHRWQALAPPIPADSASQFIAPSITALVVAPDGGVLAGGRFACCKPYYDVAVAHWDGRRWHLLRGGVNSFVSCLALGRSGEILVGTGASDNSSSWGNVWRADTTNIFSQPPLPARFNDYVYAVVMAANGDIIAGGSFTSLNGAPASYLAHWHSGSWQALPGQGGPVQALAAAPNGDIVVVGSSSTSNDGLAMWHINIFRDR
jgi:hypothetical protein